MKRLILTISAVAPAISFAGDAKSPIASPAGWEWTLSAGPGVRGIGDVRTVAGYRSKDFLMPSFVGSPSLVVPPIGGTGAPAERFYQNGYVRQDAGTGNDGSTWFWGYDTASQVQSGQLVYSATGYQSIRRDSFNAPVAGPSFRDDSSGFSPHIQLDGLTPRYFGDFRLGFSAGFDFTRVDNTVAFSNFSGTQYRDDYRDDYEDRYDLGGVIPPGAPYYGTRGGPGALILNTPSSRSLNSVLLNTTSADFYNRVSSSIDIDVFSFTLAPTLSRSWGRLDVALQAGLILNFYNWDASQSETLNRIGPVGSGEVTRWSEGNSGVDFRPGLFAQTDLTYDLGYDFTLGGFLRFDIASQFRADAGPTVYEIEPGGTTAGIMLRYTLP